VSSRQDSNSSINNENNSGNQSKYFKLKQPLIGDVSDCNHYFDENTKLLTRFNDSLEEKSHDDEDLSCKRSISSDESSLLDLQSVSSWEHDDNDYDYDNGNHQEQQQQQLLQSEIRGIKRLEQKLKLRRQRLQKLCVGRRSSFVQLVEANDVAASEITLALYKEKEQHQMIKKGNVMNGGDNRDDNDGSLSQQQRRRQHQPVQTLSHPKNAPITTADAPVVRQQQGLSIMMRMWWMILFEYNLTLSCFFTVMVVLLGHTTFYSALEVTLKCVYYTVFESWLTLDQFFLLQIMLGLGLLRINGNVFYWLNSKDYNLVRLEMQNRLKLGWWDAKFLKRIKGHRLSSAMNMFGYYLASVGVYYFYYHGQLRVLRPFEEWYVAVFRSVGGKYDPVTGQEIKVPCPDLWGAMPSTGSDYVVSKWLLDYFCNDVTAEWKLIVLLYHGLCLTITAIMAAKLGQNVLTFCD
jgi:hypothetical protein